MQDCINHAFLQTWSYTSSICYPPCHVLRPGTCLTDRLLIVISKMPQAIPTRNEPSSGSIKRKCSFKLRRYLHRNCSITGTYIALKLQTDTTGKCHWMVSMKSSLQRSIKPLQRAETHQRKKKDRRHSVRSCRTPYLQPCSFSTSQAKTTHTTTSRQDWKINTAQCHWLCYLGQITKRNICWGKHCNYIVFHSPSFYPSEIQNM